LTLFLLTCLLCGCIVGKVGH